MKYLLIMIMCSNVTGTCIPGYEWPKQFDTMYGCLESGYKQSLIKHEEIGPKDVNENGIYIKFICRKTETI